MQESEPAASEATSRFLDVLGDEAMNALLEERQRLLGRVEQQREQLERLRSIIERLAEQLEHDELLLGELDSALGHDPQLRIEDADLRFRGQRLEELAIRVLTEERGEGVEVHYREWFELLRARGHLVAGKEPLNTFLAQINRADGVERIGRRTGRYRLAKAA